MHPRPEAVVVGVALWHEGRLLAARRATEPVVWELPGGKVEPGETPEGAAVREIAEELGCGVAVTGWLDGEVAIRAGLVLRVATARLVSGEPVPREHDVVRWLALEHLEDVEWLRPDRPFVAALRAAG